jgi:hypothetical protein
MAGGRRRGEELSPRASASSRKALLRVHSRRRLQDVLTDCGRSAELTGRKRRDRDLQPQQRPHLDATHCTRRAIPSRRYTSLVRSSEHSSPASSRCCSWGEGSVHLGAHPNRCARCRGAARRGECAQIAGHDADAEHGGVSVTRRIAPSGVAEFSMMAGTNFDAFPGKVLSYEANLTSLGACALR